MGLIQKEDRTAASFTVVAGNHGRCGLVEVVLRERGEVQGREDNSAVFHLREQAAE